MSDNGMEKAVSLCEQQADLCIGQLSDDDVELLRAWCSENGVKGVLAALYDHREYLQLFLSGSEEGFRKCALSESVLLTPVVLYLSYYLMKYSGWLLSVSGRIYTQRSQGCDDLTLIGKSIQELTRFQFRAHWPFGGEDPFS